MAWKITHDYLEEDGPHSRVGVKSPGDLVGDTQVFILKDDDGETYYMGRFDAEAEDLHEGDPNSLYAALQFGESDAGCTSLWVGGKCIFG